MKKSNLTILLVHPEISRTKYNFVGIIENECLELEYIYAILKEKGYSVHLYDGQVEQQTVEEKIKKCNPDVVYVCGRTRQENFMLEYCKTAKRNNKDIITIIGGLHAQLCYKRMYKDYVDYILYGLFALVVVMLVVFIVKVALTKPKKAEEQAELPPETKEDDGAPKE